MAQIKLATCHPDKKHQAYGLCAVCYRRKYKVRRKAYADVYRKEKKDFIENTRLLKRFGIDLKYYHNLLEKQKGKCAICQTLPTNARFHIDHNHITGTIRGLLCFKCNTGIFHIENGNWLKHAKRYLKSYPD